MNMRRTVHVIDDDEAILASTSGFLKAKGFMVKTYDSAQHFLETLGPQVSGCVVTDVRMRGVSGIELLAEIRERHLALPVIVITAYADISLAVEAMKRGAVDVLEKPFSNLALVEAIREAMARSEAGAGIRPDSDSIRARLSNLTVREKEVLARLLNGVPNKIIAHELGVSTRTIETHRATVMSKMNAGSIAELVKMSLAVPQAN
jgi:two-component system, LuxR family, response regulator FixJ